MSNFNKLLLTLAIVVLLALPNQAALISQSKAVYCYSDYTLGGGNCSYAVDNNNATYWVTNTGVGGNITIDLTATYANYLIQTIEYQGYAANTSVYYGNFTASCSPDNSTWTSVGNFTGNTGIYRAINFTSNTANCRYINLGVSAPVGDTVYGYANVAVYADNQTVETQIYRPTTGVTYYNATYLPLIYSVNNSFSNTTMSEWTVTNGVEASQGTVANGSVTTTTSQALKNGGNNLTLKVNSGFGYAATNAWTFDEGNATGAIDFIGAQNATYNNGVTVTGATSTWKTNSLNFTLDTGGIVMSGANPASSASNIGFSVAIYGNKSCGTGWSCNNTVPRPVELDVMSAFLTNTSGVVNCQVLNGSSTTLTAVTTSGLGFRIWNTVACFFTNDGTRGNVSIYVNGVYNNSNTALSFGNLKSSANSVRLGQNTAKIRSFEGSLDEFIIYTTVPDSTLRSILYNKIYNQNLTISSFFTLTNGLNLTVSNNTQGGFDLNAFSLNISNSTNSSLITTVTNPLIVDTRTIPNSPTGVSVNVTIFKAGYANQTFSVSNSSNVSLFSYNITLWREQEFKAVNAVSNSTISSFSIAIVNGTNTTTYSTTNGSIKVSLGSIPVGNYNLTYTATSYNTTTFIFDANATSEVNYTAQIYGSGLTIYYYDEASCASTCRAIYGSWTATNGTTSNNSYSQAANTYSTLGYTDLPTNSVTFTFNNTVNGTYFPRQYIVTVAATSASLLNVYLLNSTSFTIAATYCAVNTGNTGVSGASFTFQRLIGSSYVTVAQGVAGSDGCFTVYLDSLTSYQAIVSATGYNTGTFTTQPKTLQYVTLTSASATLGFQLSYADDSDQVLARLLPSTNALTSYAQIINFTIYSYNGTLTNWGLQCDYNGSTIYAVNVTTSPSGGSTTTNVSLTNKTNPTNFYCYGLFDRTGYNTTYLNRTYYIFSPNATYANTSASGLVGQINNGQFSSETLFVGAIVLTTVGTAGLTSAAAGVGAPLGAGIISLALLTGFAFLGWINAGWVILYAIVTLAFSYFNSRQF